MRIVVMLLAVPGFADVTGKSRTSATRPFYVKWPSLLAGNPRQAGTLCYKNSVMAFVQPASPRFLINELPRRPSGGWKQENKCLRAYPSVTDPWELTR